MKKIMILLALSVLFAPFVLADETLVMDNELGAEIRTLQLQRSIEANLFIGAETVAYLEEQGSDTENLKELLAKLEAVLLEVKEETLSVRDFVAYQREAISIANEFRREASLSSEDRQEILRRSLEDVQQLRQRINLELRAKVLEFNRQRAEMILTRLDRDPSQARALVEEGLRGRELAARIRAEIANENMERRMELHRRLQEERRQRLAEIEQRRLEAEQRRDEVRTQLDRRALVAVERVNSLVSQTLERRSSPVESSVRLDVQEVNYEDGEVGYSLLVGTPTGCYDVDYDTRFDRERNWVVTDVKASERQGPCTMAAQRHAIRGRERAENPELYVVSLNDRYVHRTLLTGDVRPPVVETSPAYPFLVHDASHTGEELFYSLTIGVPDGCHEIKTGEVYNQRDNTFTLDVHVERTREVCTQVPERRPLRGSSKMDRKPDIFYLSINDGLVYRTLVSDARPSEEDASGTPDFSVNRVFYDNHVLQYTATVVVPSSCHSVESRIQENPRDSSVTANAVIVRDPTRDCVLTPHRKTVADTIRLGEKPNVFYFAINNELVYRVMVVDGAPYESREPVVLPEAQGVAAQILEVSHGNGVLRYNLELQGALSCYTLTRYDTADSRQGVVTTDLRFTEVSRECPPSSRERRTLTGEVRIEQAPRQFVLLVNSRETQRSSVTSVVEANIRDVEPVSENRETIIVSPDGR